MAQVRRRHGVMLRLERRYWCAWLRRDRDAMNLVIDECVILLEIRR